MPARFFEIARPTCDGNTLVSLLASFNPKFPKCERHDHVEATIAIEPFG
jgi:hypothetical protein